MHKKFLYFLATLLWLFFIGYTSSLPADEFPLFASRISTGIHFGEYFVLAFLVSQTLFYFGLSRIMSWKVTLVGLLFLAGIDEWHQRFIGGRIPSTKDFLFDALGIVGMTLIMMVTHQIQSYKVAK